MSVKPVDAAWGALPCELVAMCLAHTETATVACCSTVSRAWFSAVIAVYSRTQRLSVSKHVRSACRFVARFTSVQDIVFERNCAIGGSGGFLLPGSARSITFDDCDWEHGYDAGKLLGAWSGLADLRKLVISGPVGIASRLRKARVVPSLHGLAAALASDERITELGARVRCPRLVCLSLSFTFDEGTQRSLCNMLRCLPALRHLCLELDDGFRDEQLLSLLRAVTSPDRLHTLSLRGAAFADSSFETLVIACASLHRLDVSRNAALSGSWPRLLATPPSLCELDLYACTAIRSSAIANIAAAFRSLKVLNLGGTEHVGPAGCAVLSTAFAFGGLTKLLLPDSAALSDAALQALRLPCLAELDICAEVEKSREAKKVRKITDVGIRALRSHCAALEVLRSPYLRRVSLASIHELVAALRFLRELDCQYLSVPFTAAAVGSLLACAHPPLRKLVLSVPPATRSRPFVMTASDRVASFWLATSTASEGEVVALHIDLRATVCASEALEDICCHHASHCPCG